MNLSECCRFCFMSKSSVRPISWRLEENKIFLQRIDECTNIQLSELNQDDMKSLICSDCTFKLLIFHEFKSQSVQHDQLYRESLLSEKLSVKSEADEQFDDTFSANPFEDIDNLSNNDFKAELGEETNTPTEDQEADETYICDLCPKQFKKKDLLQVHMKKLHIPKAQESEITCKECPKKFKTEDNLQTHKQKFHNTTGVVAKQNSRKPGKCPICDKLLARASHVKEHMKIHTDERNYICDICGAAFRARKHLNTHTVVHSNDKQYVCPEASCSSSFKTLDRLRVHSKIHTGHPYSCDKCGKTFAQITNCKRHIEMHGKKLKISCKYCNEIFDNQHSLMVHRQTHLAELTYVCEIEGCTKRFDTAKSLREHINRHIGDKKYKCNICSLGFKEARRRNYHMKRIHKVFVAA